MQQDTLNEILKELGRVHGEMREGFKNVHRRQDIANGRTAKMEGKVEKIELKNAYDEGRSHPDLEKRPTTFEQEVIPMIEGFHARQWLGKTIVHWAKIAGSITVLIVFIFDLLNVIHPHL